MCLIQLPISFPRFSMFVAPASQEAAEELCRVALALTSCNVPPRSTQALPRSVGRDAKTNEPAEKRFPCQFFLFFSCEPERPALTRLQRSSLQQLLGSPSLSVPPQSSAGLFEGSLHSRCLRILSQLEGYCCPFWSPMKHPDR